MAASLIPKVKFFKVSKQLQKVETMTMIWKMQKQKKSKIEKVKKTHEDDSVRLLLTDIVWAKNLGVEVIGLKSLGEPKIVL